MKYAIVVSKKDPAGRNIKGNLLESNFKGKIYETEKESIYCDNIEVEEDIIIFATKHQSAAGKPSLSVHVPGNWTKSEVGGKERTLNIAPASLMKEMFIELNKQENNFEGEITLEATHHGPFHTKPVMFIEIGSSEEQWNNKEYGKIIAKTIINVLSKDVKKYETMFAIGGGHYPRELNKILLRTDLAIGHICPKYILEELDEELIKQAIEKNVEKVDTILVDWKGLGQHKEKVKNLIADLGLNMEKVQTIFKSQKSA